MRMSTIALSGASVVAVGAWVGIGTLIAGEFNDGDALVSQPRPVEEVAPRVTPKPTPTPTPQRLTSTTRPVPESTPSETDTASKTETAGPWTGSSSGFWTGPSAAEQQRQLDDQWQRIEEHNREVAAQNDAAWDRVEEYTRHVEEQEQRRDQRRAEEQQRIDEYNRQVNQYNQALADEINRYNSEVDEYNRQVDEYNHSVYEGWYQSVETGFGGLTPEDQQAACAAFHADPASAIGDMLAANGITDPEAHQPATDLLANACG